MEAELSSLDPAIMTGTSTFRPVSSMYDMLINLFDTSGKVQPDIADSWDTSPDGLTLTMKIQAEHHVPRRDAPRRPGGRLLVRAHAQRQEPGLLLDRTRFRASSIPAYKTSTAVDPQTVKFTLTEPDATFLSALVWNTGSIVSPTAAKQGGKDFQNKPIGTGPFKFVSWEKNIRTTMERFDGYWRGPANLDRLVWLPIVEEAARVNQLMNGQVDFIVSLAPQFVPQIQANQNLQLLQSPSLHTWWAYLNMHEEHLKDVRVRQALNYAIDQDSPDQEHPQGHRHPVHRLGVAEYVVVRAECNGLQVQPATRPSSLLVDAGYPTASTWSISSRSPVRAWSRLRRSRRRCRPISRRSE